MNFLLFFIYLSISLSIYGIIGVLLYKFYLKKKCSDISKYTQKEIDKYFNAYDNESIESLNNLFKDFEDTKDDKSFLKKVGK